MGAKILIADDEETIRSGVAKYIQLHTDKFDRIYEAGNGNEAIDIIIQQQPDVVLLDIQMPGKTGIDVMKEVQRAGLSPAIVILSGYDEFKYAQQALKYGAREYLLKPARASEILERALFYAEQKHPEWAQEESDKECDDEQENRLVRDAKAYIEEHYMEDLSLQTVADELAISRGYLSTMLNRHLEMGFSDYLNEVRIEHACLYLEQATLKNYEIAYKVGFNDDKYFSKVFRKIKGMTPKEYRNTH